MPMMRQKYQFMQHKGQLIIGLRSLCMFIVDKENDKYSAFMKTIDRTPYRIAR